MMPTDEQGARDKDGAGVTLALAATLPGGLFLRELQPTLAAGAALMARGAWWLSCWLHQLMIGDG